MRLNIIGNELKAQLLNPKRENPQEDYSQLCINGIAVLRSPRLSSSLMIVGTANKLYDIVVELLDKDKVHYVWMENGLEDHIWARFEDGKLREMTKEEYKGILR